MSDQTRPPGKTTIAPVVLTQIAKLTTLGVPGVNRLTVAPPDVNHLFKPGASEGVKINVENDMVYVDLYVILNRDENVREVSHAIQSKVARAIVDMVGMEIGKVNVHVEDIDYSEPVK
jgi:uncharacterized alkaline shock family protein YloU